MISSRSRRGETVGRAAQPVEREPGRPAQRSVAPAAEASGAPGPSPRPAVRQPSGPPRSECTTVPGAAGTPKAGARYGRSKTKPAARRAAAQGVRRVSLIRRGPRGY